MWQPMPSCQWVAAASAGSSNFQRRSAGPSGLLAGVAGCDKIASDSPMGLMGQVVRAANFRLVRPPLWSRPQFFTI